MAAITVTVTNNLSGRSETIDGLDPRGKLSSILQRVEPLMEIPSGRGRLVLDGNVLDVNDPTATLQTHGIVDGSEVGIIRSRAPKVYSIGGWDGTAQLNTSEVLDVETGKWETLPEMPDHTSEKKGMRAGAGAAVIKDGIVVVGGYDGGSPVASALVYNTSHNRWEKKPDMSNKRTCPGAIAVKNMVYVWGGKDGRTLHNGECLDFSTTPEASKWDELPPMGSCRELFTLAWFQDRIWATGGYGCDPGSTSQYLTSTEAYDLNSRQWTAMTPMLRKRAEHGVCAVKNHLYVIGGTDNRIPYDSSEVYDAITDSWADLPPMPIPRSGIGAVFVEGKIYVMGGISKQREVVKTGNAYDPEKEEWIEIPAMEQIRALHCLITLQ